MMDPLFGLVDNMTTGQQQQQQPPPPPQPPGGSNPPGMGEYTISYPTGEYTTNDHQQQFQIQHNTENAQLGKPEEAAGGQVVHVVSGNSQNEKQVYVIKLENFLTDDGHPGDSTIKFEGGEAEVGEGARNEEGPEEETSDSSSEEEEEEEETPMNEQEADAGPGPDPFLVISPEAVMAMAQSVGVELNEEDASELGCIAMNKLRNAVLIAMQFAQNENSEGITVEQFAKAEEQLGSPGIGQESVFRETGFRYAGGVSLIDDGPEIDLYACLEDETTTEMHVDEIEPVLHVHHLRPNPVNQYDQEEPEEVENPEDEIDDEMAECIRDENLTNLEGLTNENTDIEMKPLLSNESRDVDNSNIPQNSDNGNNVSTSEMNADDNSDSSEEEEAEVAETIHDLLDESEEKSDEQGVEVSESEENGDQTESLELAPEWMSYLQVLIEQILEHENNQAAGCGMSLDFKRIIRDIRKHGLQPIFPILCDMFRDYLKDTLLSRSAIMNILCIIDALVSSQSQPKLSQMTTLGCIMIEILILPPPGEVYQYLTHVFMKIMKNCNELLTWTCTYITEILKGLSETPFEEIQESCKSTMHGAICLANGLEELSIQVAHEFGWHTSILNFSENHSSVFDGNTSYKSTTQDSLLEEEILKFFYNFMRNYASLIQQTELSRIGERVTTLYGERFISFVPPEPTDPIVFSKNALATPTKSKKTRCAFRKIVYKNKEITVPCRKVVN